MKIGTLIIFCLVLFGGSLFLEKSASWGHIIPWVWVGFGALAVVIIFASRTKFRGALKSDSFGDILLNSLGLIILVLGFLSHQLFPTIIFLVEAWILMLLLNAGKSDKVEVPID